MNGHGRCGGVGVGGGVQGCGVLWGKRGRSSAVSNQGRRSVVQLWSQSWMSAARSRVQVVTSNCSGMAGSKNMSGEPQAGQKVRSRAAKRTVRTGPSKRMVPAGKKVQATTGAPEDLRQSSQWQRLVPRGSAATE